MASFFWHNVIAARRAECFGNRVANQQIYFVTPEYRLARYKFQYVCASAALEGFHWFRKFSTRLGMRRQQRHPFELPL